MKQETNFGLFFKVSWTEVYALRLAWTYFIWGNWASMFYLWGRGGGQKCPTLVFSKLDMVWQWNLAHIEAILWQVKTNREFSELWIIFDGISTTLHNTVKFTIFYIYIIDGVSVNNSKELVNSTYLQHWINILRFFVVFRWCQVNFWVSKRVFLSLSLLRWCN